MTRRIFTVAMAVACAALTDIAAQAAAPAAAPGDAEAAAAPPPAVTMAQAVEAARASGDDFALVASALDNAKRQRALDLAKQSVSVSANGSVAVVDGFGRDTETSGALQAYEQGILSKAVGAAAGGSVSSNYHGIAAAPAASLSLATPLSKATLSLSQAIPARQPDAETVTQSSAVGLSLSRTVWDGYPGGQYKATLEKSLIALRGKELAAGQGDSAAVVKVKQAYLTMLAAQRDLAIKKQVLEKLRALLAQIEATYAIRQASAIDLKTAQVNARSAEIDAAISDKALRLANERLATIMGRDPAERFSVADIDDPEMPAATVDEAIATGLDRRSDFGQLELSEKSWRIDAALARAQAKPLVTVTGGAGLAVGWMSPAVVAEALSVGAKIALPVYDSGAAELQARASEGQAALYGLQAAQLKKTIASDIRDYFEGARLQAEKAALARESAELAEAQFELVKAQNKFGTATTQDVLAASVTAATAEVSYGTAKSAYLSAVLQLSTAMGL